MTTRSFIAGSTIGITILHRYSTNVGGFLMCIRSRRLNKPLSFFCPSLETNNTKLQSITQNLYNDTNQEPTNESYDTNDVSDVEFEEVK